jgi:hypothetical protein
MAEGNGYERDTEIRAPDDDVYSTFETVEDLAEHWVEAVGDDYQTVRRKVLLPCLTRWPFFFLTDLTCVLF